MRPGGLYSLDAGVAWRAEALAGAGVAAGAVAALARQLAALAVGARRAELLAAPASEAGGAHAGARDGVAQGPVLALAPVAAMRAPVVTIAACKRGAGQDGRIPMDSPGWRLGPAFPSLHHSSLDRRQQGDSGGGGAFTNNLHQLVINLYPPPLNNPTSSEGSFLNASLSQGHSSPTKTGQSSLPNPSSVRKLWNYKLFNLCRTLLGGFSLPLSQALSLGACLLSSL